MIWSTEILNFIQVNNLPLGLFTSSPYFKLNDDIRKGFIEFKYTAEEITNIISVNKDIFNLIPYLKLDNIELRDYQKELLEKFTNNQFNLILNSRQVGISLINAIFCLHYILSNSDKQIVIACNKLETGVELIDKIKNLYSSLPFYMKPGVLAWNQASIKFDNGVRISITNGKTAGIGFQVHCLLVQDAAHISNFSTIKRALFPVMFSIKNTKMIINSTPNGINDFYNLVVETEKGNTSFNLTKVYWWQIPGRDEEWKRKVIMELGSEEYFNQEYNLQFIIPCNNDRSLMKSIIDEIDSIVGELKTYPTLKLVKKLGKLQKQLKKLVKD